MGNSIFLGSRLFLFLGMLAFFYPANEVCYGQQLSEDEKSLKELLVPKRWEYSQPLVRPIKRPNAQSRAQKDPTFIFHNGKWHLFMTVKLPGRSAIEYCCFEKWENADRAPRTLLKICDSEYFCAPQVFYFQPHKMWYLIYQVGVEGQKKMWVACSTTKTIEDPLSWTRAKPILDGKQNDPRTVGGLDYWIICDDERAYLFFTSLDGRMWRCSTSISAFPNGFSNCQVALRGKIFEASHTYRVKGHDKYLTIIEEDGRRYFKAYWSKTLDGIWEPLADSPEQPFASWKNIQPENGVKPWTDNVSHGELVRDGIDEKMVIDPDNLQFVFQGMFDKHKSGKNYGQFQWRIGMLKPLNK